MTVQDDVIVERQTNRWTINDLNISTPTQSPDSIVLIISKGYNDGTITTWHTSTSFMITGTELETLYLQPPTGSTLYEAVRTATYDYAKLQGWIPPTAIDEV